MANLFDVFNQRAESKESKARVGEFRNKSSFLEPRVFSVSEFYGYVNELLGLEEVIVEGEISELRVAKGYLIYFSLNDEQSVLPCLMFKNKLDVTGLPIEALEVGSTVRVQGVPNVYAKRGGFSFMVNQVSLVGEGALKRAFELLKKKLESEGLFDPRFKRPLPLYPEMVGLITSQGAAAYTDFLKVLKARWGGLKIHFYPVSVQGETAIQEMLDALHYFTTQFPYLDAVVLTRGGGSLEDLAVFNAESIVRAIRESKWPVICAVGHERDESLADYAADLRASTPSNAAELLVPTRQEEMGFLESLQKKFLLHLEGKIANEQQYLERILAVMERFFQRPKTELVSFESRFEGAVNVWLSRLKQDLAQKERLFKSFDPSAVLKRGYSITVNESGKIIKSKKEVAIGDEIATSLHDGIFQSSVTKI